jgi:hypothetical protein
MKKKRNTTKTNKPKVLKLGGRRLTDADLLGRPSFAIGETRPTPLQPEGSPGRRLAELFSRAPIVSPDPESECDADQSPQSQSKAETSSKMEVPTTYVWKGETWPMGKCRGPEQCDFMETQPGYEEWADAEAAKMWGQVEAGINKELAKENNND